MQFLEESPLFVMFALIGLGIAFGRVTIRGLNLGSPGVLFAALVAGHFGLAVPDGMGVFGLVLFVYCVGVGAGGRFFHALMSHGSVLARLSLAVVASGALVTWGLARWLEIPADLAAGLFAGAMTSTPALAAASDLLGDSGSLLPIGYGIAYPFGVVGVVLFVQLLPKLMRQPLTDAADSDSEPASERIVSVMVRVTNPGLVGQRIGELRTLAPLGCQVTRVWRDDRLVPLAYDDRFEDGLKLLIVGHAAQMETAVQLVGRRCDESFVIDVERERRQVVVTARAFLGRSLANLHLLRDHRVSISRLTRMGLTFVPGPDTVIDANDVLTVVGAPDSLERFARAAGHRDQSFNETDLLSLGVGIALGILVGRLQLGMPGGFSLSLGLAGGPLLVGLVLGHFGRLGGLVGYIPRPTRILLQEMGLVLFLADAGIRGGGAFVATIQTHGLAVFGLGVAVTLVPLLVAIGLALRVFRMPMAAALGGVCGGMTSTPALGVITARTDNQGPVVSYATAYPVALILMTVFAKLLVHAIVAWG
jgi:putative transport protein